MSGAEEDGDPEWFRRIEGVFGDPAERDRYIADGRVRLRIVMRLIGDLERQGVRKVLELGANPYFLTMLLRRRHAFELELANYFGPSLADGRYTHAAELDGQKLEFPYSHFNVETSPFPYADARFDCVLFCEILEHLLLDPDHVLSEIGRVVRPGGFVLVSTPNVTRLTNLYFLALGRNIYDGYSAHGPYGRHNREYTHGEVVALLARHGFDLWHLQVENLWPLARRFTYIQALRPNVWREHMFVVGRKRER